MILGWLAGCIGHALDRIVSVLTYPDIPELKNADWLVDVEQECDYLPPHMSPWWTADDLSGFDNCPQCLRGEDL